MMRADISRFKAQDYKNISHSAVYTLQQCIIKFLLIFRLHIAVKFSGKKQMPQWDLNSRHLIAICPKAHIEA